MGARCFGGRFCFIARWQIVQNGIGVSGGTQPQIYVNFCLYSPASRSFPRKLGRGDEEGGLSSRRQAWALFWILPGHKPQGLYRGLIPRLRLYYKIEKNMTPITTMYNSRGWRQRWGLSLKCTLRKSLPGPGPLRPNQWVCLLSYFVDEER